MIVVIAYNDNGSDELYGPFVDQAAAERFLDGMPDGVYIDVQIRELLDPAQTKIGKDSGFAA